MNNTYEYEIKADYDNLTISLGDWYFDCTERPYFHRAGSILDITTKVLKDNGLGTIPYKLGRPYSKQIYQTFTEKFKVKPRTFVNIVNKLHYKVLAEGLTKSVLHSVCYSGPCNRELYIPIEYRKVKPLVVQCVKDGISNVAPLVAVTGKDTKELKAELGKGLWKRYCKRSLTANAIVANCLRNNATDNTLKDLIEVPITYLKYFGRSEHTLIVGRLVREERCVSKRNEVRHISNIVMDTYDMASDLDATFNPNWSWKRFKEEHDRLSLLQLEGQYSKDKFSSETYKQLPEEFSCDYGVAKLLTSETEVAKEGRVMHHCVAGYGRSCTAGTYAVYHVVDRDGCESTLGLRYGAKWYEEGVEAQWNVDQHYTYNNYDPSRAATYLEQELIDNIRKNHENIQRTSR